MGKVIDCEIVYVLDFNESAKGSESSEGDSDE